MILAVFGARCNRVLREVTDYLKAVHEQTPVTLLVTGRSIDGPCAVARNWAIRAGIEVRSYESHPTRNARILDENPKLDLIVIVSGGSKGYSFDNRNLAFLARLRKIRVFELEITP